MLAVSATVVDRETLLETLRRQVQQLEKTRRPEHAETFSSGCPAFDRLLPGRGWQPGTLVEWFTAEAGTGAFMLALALRGERANSELGTRNAERKAEVSAFRVPSSSPLILISDPARQFHAPAAAALGIHPAQIVVLHPPSAAEELWALDQALRCEAVALVWAWLPQLGDHNFRRLQLEVRRAAWHAAGGSDRAVSPRRRRAPRRARPRGRPQVANQDRGLV